MIFFKKFKTKADIESAEIIRKAENLVSLANISALGSQKIVLNKFPQLRDAKGINNWDLFCTVSATYAAFSRCGTFIKNKKLISKLDNIVLGKLNDFDPNGEGAFNNLEDFLIKILKENPNKITPEFIEASAGTWLLWNLTGKEPIEDEQLIACTLGTLFFTEFANYYS
jgi:hypothetical protein